MQPKGILTDESGVKWEVWYEGQPSIKDHNPYIIVPHIERKPLFVNKAGYEVFKDQRCFKWGGSNIKRNTDKDVYQWAIAKYDEYTEDAYRNQSFHSYISDLIKEKCFTPKQ